MISTFTTETTTNNIVYVSYPGMYGYYGTYDNKTTSPLTFSNGTNLGLNSNGVYSYLFPIHCAFCGRHCIDKNAGSSTGTVESWYCGPDCAWDGIYRLLYLFEDLDVG